jgi:hypothetical protein
VFSLAAHFTNSTSLGLVEPSALAVGVGMMDDQLFVRAHF